MGMFSTGNKAGEIHGHTASGVRTPTYRSWQNMIARCTQPSNPAFAYYKKRGITVCDRWRSFEHFLADMGLREKGTTIDRFPDNDGNYEPGNCRWASKRDQANNRITNLLFNYRGSEYTLVNLSRVTGVNKNMLRNRLCRSNLHWTVEGAVTTPKLTRKNQGFHC